MNSDIYTLPPQDNSLTREDVLAMISESLRNFNDPMKVQQGYMQSANFISGSTGWQLTPTGAEINGGVTVGSLNIPDSTTANSFHVDTSGNSWWGANVATGYTGANAYILNTGTAVFKSVSIGGTAVQYVITNSGIFSYGDGSDGTVTFSDQGTAPAGTTKTDNTAGATIFRLDRDVYYDTLTINSTVTVKTNGYRVFAKTASTINGTLQQNGVVGGAASLGTAGTAGAALTDGYLKGSVAGSAGSTGGILGTPGHGGESGAGLDGSGGTNTSNSLGTNGSAGGSGGTGGNSSIADAGHPAGSVGAVGTITASNVKLIANWHLATLLDVGTTGATLKFNTSASGAGGTGGGAGGGTGSGAGGGGGGSASSGGMLALYSKTITIGAAGIVSANGGIGGAGGNGTAGTGTGGSGAGGGGGPGGNGGIVILVYNMLTNGGSVTASAGAGGAKGTGASHSPGSPGANGSDGTAGSAGVIYQFQLSL